MKLIIGVVFYLIIVFQVAYAQQFVEVSNEIGLDHIHPGIDHREVGAGVVVFDFNSDGWDDIFQCGGTFPSKLWVNNKGVFEDVTEEQHIDRIAGLMVQGASSADFDNDGFEDLFICNNGITSDLGDGQPPVLLKNINGRYFEPVFVDIFNEIGNYPGCVWGDINGDGFSDLYVLNYLKSMAKEEEGEGENRTNKYKPTCLGNKLFLNQDGKGFIEVSKTLQLDDIGCGLAASFTDFDNDNDVDLILLNDFGHFNNLGNKIFRNEYPELKFTDITDSLNFQSKFYGMGVGAGDYNNDGVLDYYLTNIGKNYFFCNENGRFNDRANDFNIDLSMVTTSETGTSWSGLFLDVENDGDVDLFVAKGYLESFEEAIKLDQNKFFINHLGKFRDVSLNSGINDSSTQRGAAILDFNNDGKLDIVTNELKVGRSEFAKMDQKIKLFKNISKSKINWVGIKLIGSEDVNRSCVGCSVTIGSGKNIQIREVDGGSGHSSQSTKTLYFGLGKKKFAENISIQWLGKETQLIGTMKGGKVYTIEYLKNN